MENIKLLVLTNNQVLVSKIEEVAADLGEPDCKLVDPYLITGETLQPWLFEYTMESTVMIRSDNILTISDPKPTILEKYQTLTK